jgi:hypothetical protein
MYLSMFQSYREEKRQVAKSDDLPGLLPDAKQEKFYQVSTRKSRKGTLNGLLPRVNYIAELPK